MKDNSDYSRFSYTCNNVKLLKHLDKLKIIQDGKTPSPVMFHISICNICNLQCSFCCFANRNKKDILSYEKICVALDSFKQLGTRGVEINGGGEPTLHPQINEIVNYAYDIGYKIGITTNGKTLNKINDWNKFSWVRLGMYGFDEGYDYDINLLRKSSVDISAAYVWDGDISTSSNPNIHTNKQKTDNFYKMINWVESNKIPTRIAFNAIKDVEIVKKDILFIKQLLSKIDLHYAFLSDFNYKSERINNNCYMHMVKPFVYTDGNVYVCPSATLSLENNYNVNEKFKICDIDNIINFYKNGVTKRIHDCTFCKYSSQNELIDNILLETTHNDFA